MPDCYSLIGIHKMLDSENTLIYGVKVDSYLALAKILPTDIQSLKVSFAFLPATLGSYYLT